MEFQFRGVNEAFMQLTHTFYMGTGVLSSPSRDGEVRMFEEPVLITYNRPQEHVLFSPVRDANPFFHLHEVLWMLAGRNDVEYVKHFNSNIGFCSDDGETFWGCYGPRWRSWFNSDQLTEVACELAHNPNGRRCVISMWDPLLDPSKAYNGGKDVPCNTHIYLQVRNNMLDITVCNRSNDLVWGLLGANVVQFSILLEYMVGLINLIRRERELISPQEIGVGKYHHFTTNLHYYVNRFDIQKNMVPYTNHYYRNFGILSEYRIGADVKLLDAELKHYLDRGKSGNYLTPFLEYVAKPMLESFDFYKAGDYSGSRAAYNRIQLEDWRIASQEWIERRITAKHMKDGNPYIARSQKDGTLNPPT